MARKKELKHEGKKRLYLAWLGYREPGISDEALGEIVDESDEEEVMQLLEEIVEAANGEEDPEDDDDEDDEDNFYDPLQQMMEGEVYVLKQLMVLVVRAQSPYQAVRTLRQYFMQYWEEDEEMQMNLPSGTCIYLERLVDVTAERKQDVEFISWDMITLDKTEDGITHRLKEFTLHSPKIRKDENPYRLADTPEDKPPLLGLFVLP